MKPEVQRPLTPPIRFPEPPPILEALATGELVDCRPAPVGSNATFFAVVSHGARWRCPVVYKPRRGEAPLWDFPEGTLYRREYTSYLLSEAVGWGFVPPTVVRDGPYGIGAVQVYVASDPTANYFTLRRRYREEMVKLCAFDVIANNADRKAGHCLLGTDGRLWAIDHGITFHSEPKLRTVIWDFAGERLPRPVVEDLQHLRDELGRPGGLAEQLADLLTESEVEAFVRRLEALLAAGVFPLPGPWRSVPWPLV
ncbi:MAG: SCO1664 family protein [Chloroflexi bacterium]|nr:SCO1664 family protein [Chloroflexota bacterium]